MDTLFLELNDLVTRRLERRLAFSYEGIGQNCWHKLKMYLSAPSFFVLSWALVFLFLSPSALRGRFAQTGVAQSYHWMMQTGACASVILALQQSAWIVCTELMVNFLFTYFLRVNCPPAIKHYFSAKDVVRAHTVVIAAGVWSHLKVSVLAYGLLYRYFRDSALSSMEKLQLPRVSCWAAWEDGTSSPGWTSCEASCITLLLLFFFIGRKDVKQTRSIDIYIEPVR